MEGGDAAAVRSAPAGWTTRGWSVQGRIGSDRSEARWGRLRRRTPEAYWTHPFRSSGTYWTHRFGAADGGVLDGGVLDTPFRGDVLDTPFRSSGTYWTHRFGATGGDVLDTPFGGGPQGTRGVLDTPSRSTTSGTCLSRTTHRTTQSVCPVRPERGRRTASRSPAALCRPRILTPSQPSSVLPAFVRHRRRARGRMRFPTLWFWMLGWTGDRLQDVM